MLSTVLTSSLNLCNLKQLRNHTSMASAYASLLSISINLDLIQNHPRHSLSFHNDQIASLREIVSFFIDFMASYHNSHKPNNKEAAQNLDRLIARAAYAVEDAIESHIVDRIRARSSFPCFPLDLQSEIDDMEFVKRKAIMFRKSQPKIEAETALYSTTTAAASSTSPTTVKNSIIGFDDVLLQLTDFLVGETTRRVIPIVGTGGIGKTTLANTAFQHSVITRHFDVRLWATISQQYVVEQILQDLLSLESSCRTVNELGEELYKKLYGRRYLIILDDMWSIDLWDKIKFFFPSTGDGSRIVVTTRQSDVAHHLGSLCLSMHFLDEKRSWDLFCLKAFADEVCPPELEDIGKKIVRKCNGLPLAIIVIGGHLRNSSRTIEYWDYVILNCREHDQLFDVLSLSYSYLPIHLKPCFLYMGTFPEDQEILVSDLINLWIAEGFPTSSNAQSLEEVAKGYLKDLIARNLVSVDTWNIPERCRIHDVLRELCIHIAEKEAFFCDLRTPRALRKARRVVINGRIPHERRPTKMFRSLRSAPLVRSLKCRGGGLWFDMKLLRVLNEVDIVFKNEVDEVFLDSNHQELVNLRYVRACLDYKRDGPLYLSSSISLLWNLQTINITILPSVLIAPHEIWEMPQLRSIQIYRVCLPDPLQGDTVLLNLHTLSDVRNLRLSEEVCARIPYIKELKLSYNNSGREHDDPKSYYHPHNLVLFHHLESLACHFDLHSRWCDFTLCLSFPICLKSLCLGGSRLRWEELTMVVGSLPGLETLVLLQSSVIGSEWICVEGKFVSLNTLMINCYGLVSWEASKIHFPVLKNLVVSHLSRLDEFPSGIGEIPTLEHVVLSGCSVSLAISAMRMMVEQEEQGNVGLQMQVCFGINHHEKVESFKKKLEEEGLKSNNLNLETSLYKFLNPMY